MEYRHIRCKVSSLSVWNHLMVHRSLARNVRRLEILDERAASSELLIPSDILNSDTDMDSTDDELGMHEKQERFLVGALGKMTSLHSFTWACNHSPISIDNVWPTLLKCHSLQEVDISDNLAFSKGGESTESESGSSTSSKARRQIVVSEITLCCFTSCAYIQIAFRPQICRGQVDEARLRVHEASSAFPH
jgi:hypothetical protein